MHEYVCYLLNCKHVVLIYSFKGCDSNCKYKIKQLLALNLMYCPIVLTCQMHTDYTVSAHDTLIFEKCSVVFVICTDNNQKMDVWYSSNCGIPLTRTVISQWSKSQVSNLLVVRSSLLRLSFFCIRTLLKTANTYISYSTTLLIVCFVFLFVFWFRNTKHILIYIRLYGV